MKRTLPGQTRYGNCKSFLWRRFRLDSGIQKSFSSTGLTFSAFCFSHLSSSGQSQGLENGGLKEKMAARGFTRATENFSPDLLSNGNKPTSTSVTSSMGASGTSQEEQQSIDDFAAGIETSAATNVSLERDLLGPWLVMAENIPALQGGELFVDGDGFVFYRPANGLGHGIGKLDIISADGAIGTAFLIDLEVYQFSPEAQRLPRSSTHVKISGVINKVHSSSTDYTTFSLLGAWEPAADQAENSEDILAGAFHAAKIMPWNAKAADLPWEPNKDIVRAFQEVFPVPLQLNSHIHRRKAAQEKQQNNPKTLRATKFGEGPFHMDLSPYRIAPELSELYYVPQYISEEEEKQIIQRIQQTPEEFKSKLKKRTCQEWGCTMCNVCEKSFVSDANTPLWVQQTTDMLVYDGIFTPSAFPNSVRIHEYEKDEGIGPHSDGPIYVPLVTVLSAASTSVMHFYPRTPLHESDPMEHYRDTFKFKDGSIGSKTPMLSVILEPRSLLIFAGDCYYDHPHGISDEPLIDLRPGRGCGDIVNRHLLSDESKELEEINRSYRVSLTTRNLLPRCSDQPRRAEYGMKRAWYVYHQQPVPEPLFDPGLSNTGSSKIGSDLPQSSTSNHHNASPLFPEEDLRRWEAKLDRVLAEHQEIKEELKKLRELMMVVASSNAHYQKESSTILNHVSSTLLDVQSKVEDTMEAMEERSEDKLN